MKVLILLTMLSSAYAACQITPDVNGHVDIPDTWSSIGYIAFSGCTSLKSVTMRSL